MTSQRTRERMVDRLREQGISDERVLSAMSSVPRHVFVEEALASRAYEDTALPIGLGQTISQPYVVARMIEALRAGGRELGKVLEVYSIERIQALLDRARRNLLGLKLSNLRLTYGDGNLGIEKAAPFDSIIVAAAAPQVPQALLQQLAVGGRMILPLKTPKAGRGTQQLVLIERSPRGYTETAMDAVRFVPLETGKL